MPVTILVELKFGDAGVFLGEKSGEPQKKTSEQGEKQRQTQTTYDTKPESNPSHIDGRRAVSSLCHLCSLEINVLQWNGGVSDKSLVQAFLRLRKNQWSPISKPLSQLS